MSVVPLRQARWHPDEHLIDAAIAGRVHSNDLATSDRAWLVAQLTHRGHPNDTIAAWLHCSRRTVQMARIDPIAVLTARLLAAEAAAEDARRQVRASQVTPAAMAQLLADRDRLRDSRAQLIDQLAEMRRRCDTPCPPQVLVIHPTRPHPRAAAADATLPLFQIGDPNCVS
ncbi:hypothetical protein D5S18_24965 [Nocardia panacis]|uniref:Uncharacterized protein n=1 Tax=Nocardia panacis TaxID=2340916 RepID=A0A3A4KP03_9NOCA|nr:hypothetical protein [Nocardia panacis]RJO71425.1 hypothetical protein D5S18_24965 [Nocardia panacis]